MALTDRRLKLIFSEDYESNVLLFWIFSYNSFINMIRFISKISPRHLTGHALIRVDFNTTDSWRMEAVIPTIQYVSGYADRIILITHKGRPVAQSFSRVDGTNSSQLATFSVAKDAQKLSRLLKKKVLFVGYDHFSSIQKIIRDLPSGSVILLENIRFWKGEESNQAQFARQLAGLGDYFVNDAFAVCHRAAASTVGITSFLPSYGGLSLEKEMLHLGALLKKPAHPFLVVIGGGKAADKLPVIKRLARLADIFLVAGASANTIYQSQGGDVRQSLIDSSVSNSDIAYFKKLIAVGTMMMPVDYAWENGKILDIGPRTANLFAQQIARAKTILWSGPAGFVEKKKFAVGSIAIAQAIVQNRIATTITGGGETVEFLKRHGFDSQFTFVSTGGSALLDFLSGQKLPGIEALK
ncbi:MAG: hypothetical protein RIQ54_481 [Candidatus Parcubacteria bacterium]|jgi:phosphoglycerate kinase